MRGSNRAASEAGPWGSLGFRGLECGKAFMRSIPADGVEGRRRGRILPRFSLLGLRPAPMRRTGQEGLARGPFLWPRPRMVVACSGGSRFPRTSRTSSLALEPTAGPASLVGWPLFFLSLRWEVPHETVEFLVAN